MLRLKLRLKEAGITQRYLAKQLGVSPTTIAKLLNDNYWGMGDIENFKQKLTACLVKLRITEPINELLEIVTAESLATDTVTITPKTYKQETFKDNEDITMLLAKQALFPATKKHFSLFRDPFAQDVRSCEDVFSSADVCYVRESLFQTAKHGGFMAVVGESGAGKSTLRRDLIERINTEHSNIIVIEPYIIAMEDNDIKGKTLKASHIAESIIHTLAPLENVKRSPEARFRQLHRVLKESSRSGYSHVLIVEEAHSLPIPTLKHLKRFFELEDGFKKLLSIVLVGQPELKLKLSERNTEVREVVQRCEVVELAPLDAELEKFVAFKLAKVDKKISDIFEEDTFFALRNRLTVTNRKKVTSSLLYPLTVGNLLTAAMNMAAQLGVPLVNADVVNNV
ncbi:AAA family ATPase [Phocoenobacter skyensis]|uniref:AAA family ATPase n=1 Tax=Phocoenobacter skyensis TaxID=97481 RepID=A0ABT9JN56_9PAST|nr:AAA family ATPase [Pasteurella skyensis]MDP8080219.1 AAA family ATPase [Pasteurella skyensis]MDP8086242.1 AAA family ATPase [Pasteurella skyensis]